MNYNNENCQDVQATGASFQIDGCDTAALAEQYGTPLYVVSETSIEERCREIRRDFLDKYPGARAVYACKAFQTLDMCRLVLHRGLGLDVVSGGELFTALKAGANPSEILFHGNNKSYHECCMAVDNNVGTMVADNLSELLMLNDIGALRNKKVGVLLRITPGVDTHTHKYISTGHQDSKFGFSLEDLLENGVLERAFGLAFLNICGFHFHIGSQLTDHISHLLAVDVLLSLVKTVKETCGFIPFQLNLGGGFGIQYKGDSPRKPLSYFTDPMMEKIIRFCEEQAIPVPEVIIEPGRWIVGEAGITLYRIGSVKDTGAGRVYAAVDGGFTDNPRTALYQASYEVVAVEKPKAPRDRKITIAGKCCESGDVLVWDAELPSLQRGDLVAVLATGAYNYSMSNNYNRIPRPAVVMVKEGTHRLSIRRETYEDLLATEQNP